MTGSALRRYRAERLLRKDFPGLRAKVLAVVRSQLGAKGIALGHSDLEDCYSQAFAGLYTTVIEGEEVENPTGWLVTVTCRRAIDESRAAARRRAIWEELTVGHSLASPDDLWPAAPARDVAGALDDRATLRHLFEGLRSSLSSRECEAASLCYLQGLTRAEAAKQMGIGEARMRKLMEGDSSGRQGVAGKVGELLSTIKAGEWCEQQSSLMRAYAFGILDPEGKRHELAVAHSRECPACRAHVASLRGLAAVLPPLPLTLLLAGGGGALAGSSVDSGPAGTTPGVGSGARTGAGWIGGAGSLAGKLAVLSIVAVGGGLALHGSGAHGNSKGALRAFGGPSVAPGEARSRFSLVTPLGETHHRSAIHESLAHRSRRKEVPAHSGSSGRGVSATGRSAVAPEFTPEQVQAPPRASAPPPTAPSAGEFGF
jgi:DNA-directed RNA polymerase specialized sigma24 family protein